MKYSLDEYNNDLSPSYNKPTYTTDDDDNDDDDEYNNNSPFSKILHTTLDNLMSHILDYPRRHNDE